MPDRHARTTPFGLREGKRERHLDHGGDPALSAYPGAYTNLEGE